MLPALPRNSHYKKIKSSLVFLHVACSLSSASQAAGLILGRTGEPSPSQGIRRALWRPLGGGHAQRTHPSSKSPNFLAADLGAPAGDRLKLKSGDSGSGKKASFRNLWLPSTAPADAPPPPPPRAPRSPAAAPAPTLTKAGRGKQKRGEERQEMGRAGPAQSSCCFLPKSLEGPESRAAALGRRAGGGGSGHLGYPGLPGGSRVRGPGDRQRKGQGLRREKRCPGAQSHAGSKRARLRPLVRLRPAPPSLSPIVLRQSGRRPPPGPQVSVSVPPPPLPLSLLLPLPPPLPPVSGSPSIPLSSSSSLLLSPDTRLLRTPAPGSPAASELTEGLQTWGGCLLSPVPSPVPGPDLGLSPLCAEIACLCGQSRLGMAGYVGVP